MRNAHRNVVAMVLFVVAGMVPAQPASTQPSAGAPGATTTRPAALAEAQAAEAILKALRPEFPQVRVAPLQANNPRLGEWAIPDALPGYRLFCATLDPAKASPARRFAAVTGDGRAIAPFDTGELTTCLLAADKSKWTDDDFVKVAILFAHISSEANEDGWRLLSKPDDLIAINMGMPRAGPVVDKRDAAAQQIVAPAVERGKDGVTKVTFYAWHVIGGLFRRWEVQIQPHPMAIVRELGRFGGAAYH